MNLLQRIGYYLGGFSLGLIILAFFLNGKRASCDYGPEARVLKNINSKKLTYSNSVLNKIKNDAIDSITINDILKNGKIDFSLSESRKKPCAVYYISKKKDMDKTMYILIENCDSLVTITEINFLD